MAAPRRNGPATGTTWTSTQAYTLAIVCLVAGLAIGYLFRGSAAPGGNTTAASPPGPAQIPAGNIPVPGGSLDPKQAAEMVDRSAVPLLAEAEKNPKDASKWVRLANLYYDAQLYPKAIEYYERAVKIDSTNPDVLTDLGTAYFYNGNADRALQEFNRSLKIRPNYAPTLFNTGIVRWQGKNDSTGAVQAWEQLLRTNPNYPERQRVQELIAQAQQQSSR